MSHGIINALKTGIKFADRVGTVNPTYAREICDSPLGMGLQSALRSRADGVVGILNGVDYGNGTRATILTSRRILGRKIYAANQRTRRR